MQTMKEREIGSSQFVDFSGPPPQNMQEAASRVKEAKGVGQLLGAMFILCGLCLTGIAMLIVMMFLSVLHIYFIVVGSLHIHDCRIQPKIPIYLVVTGVFLLLRVILTYYNHWLHPKVTKRPMSQEEMGKPGILTSIINLFLLIWLICGCIWVLPTRSTVNLEKIDSESYCNKLTWYTAYIYVIFCLVIAALCLVSGCCLCIALIGKAASGRGDAEDSTKHLGTSEV